MFQPLGDKILVQVIEEATETKGGIILPETAKEKPQRGKVIAVGTGVFDMDQSHARPLLVKEGDMIVFQRYAGVEMTIEDEEYLVLRESEVIGVIHD